MLLVKVQVNERLIDLILIHNTGKMRGNKTIYEIIEPASGERIGNVLYHTREDGYRPLLRQALDYLEEWGVEPLDKT